MNCRTYFSPDMSRYVLFTESVLRHMYAHAQRTWRQTEAGGEIFSPSPYSPRLLVDTVTGPHPNDRRSRRSYNPDVQAATRARETQYENNRHAVGLWHTHPEHYPSPSGLDQRSTEDYLNSFGQDRAQYLSVIIGNRGASPEMTVWSAEKCGAWLRWMEFSGSLPILVSGRQSLR